MRSRHLFRTVIALSLALSAGRGAIGQGVTGDTTLEATIAARAIQPGEVIKLQVSCSCGNVAPVATAFGAAISLTAEGPVWIGLFGIDLDVVPGTYPLVVSVPGTTTIQPRTIDLRVLNKEFRTRQLRVNDIYVTPPAAVEARIAREARTLQALMAKRTPRAWEGPFAAPVSARPSDSFGMRSVFNGQARQPHGGTDFSSPAGTPILAPGAGHIVLADNLYFTGNTVVVDHGAGLFSMMAHLSKTQVKAGQSVSKGETLGLVGATGRVTGPHLHWGVRLSGARVDPLSLLAISDPPH